jgi:hypothetical protein
MDTEHKEPTQAQRQAMAKLAEELFTKRIQAARDQEGELVAEITETLRKELGVDALDHQIKSMEDQIRILEKKREQTGWSNYGLIESSKAGRLLKGRVSQQSTDVKKLEAERKQVLASIWTCESVEELEKLVEGL